MKNYLVLFGFCVVVLSSCQNQYDSYIKKSETKMGYISLNLPSISSSARAVIPTDYASSYTDTYGIYIYNTDNFYSADQTSSSISVPVGEYTVCVFAGKQVSPSYKIFLGSGYAENVIVEQDKRTNVTITLSTPNISLETPDEVIANRDFTVNYSFAPNNPKVALLSGSFYTFTPDSTEVFYSPNAISFENDTYSFSRTITAPTTAMSLKVSITSCPVSLTERHTEEGKVAKYWFLPDYYYTSLVNISQNTVEIIDDPTGIGITVLWE
jgi:hypothetical protein